MVRQVEKKHLRRRQGTRGRSPARRKQTHRVAGIATYADGTGQERRGEARRGGTGQGRAGFIQKYQCTRPIRWVEGGQKRRVPETKGASAKMARRRSIALCAERHSCKDTGSRFFNTDNCPPLFTIALLQSPTYVAGLRVRRFLEEAHFDAFPAAVTMGGGDPSSPLSAVLNREGGEADVIAAGSARRALAPRKPAVDARPLGLLSKVSCQFKASEAGQYGHTPRKGQYVRVYP